MFSEGHNNGIVKGIPIHHNHRKNANFLPYNSSRRKKIDVFPTGTVYRYTFDDTIIMCVKTALCIKFNIWVRQMNKEHKSAFGAL